MGENDFRSNEKSMTVSTAQAGTAKIEFVGKDGASYHAERPTGRWTTVTSSTPPT